MRYRTSIYIPSHLTRRFDVHALIEQITRGVGGVTIDDKRGAWVSPKDGLVCEHIAVYSWWHTPACPHVLEVTKIARTLLVEAKEEAVLIEYVRPHGHTAVIAKLNDDGEVTW